MKPANAMKDTGPNTVQTAPKGTRFVAVLLFLFLSATKPKGPYTPTDGWPADIYSCLTANDIPVKLMA